MECSEIDSFVGKFKYLVDAGFKASLKFSTLDGEINVTLEASFGSPKKENCQSYSRGWFHGRRRGPSYERRQEQRRQQFSDNVSNEHPVNNAREAAVEVAGLVVSGNEEEVAEVVKLDANEAVSKCETDTQSLNTEEVLEKKVDVKKDQDLPPNFDALVHATVLIENSPSNRIEKDIYKAIFGIIDSKDHIKRNVGRVRVEDVLNHSLSDHKFMHEATFMFFVDSSRLWESPKAYLWKHFGNAEWILPDGSKLVFVRMLV